MDLTNPKKTQNGSGEEKNTWKRGKNTNQKEKYQPKGEKMLGNVGNWGIPWDQLSGECGELGLGSAPPSQSLSQGELWDGIPTLSGAPEAVPLPQRDNAKVGLLRDRAERIPNPSFGEEIS